MGPSVLLHVNSLTRQMHWLWTKTSLSAVLASDQALPPHVSQIGENALKPHTWPSILRALPVLIMVVGASRHL